MRITLLPSAYAPAVGGVEELTRRIARHLICRGHQVEVWTIRHPEGLPPSEKIDGVSVRRFAMPLPAASASSLLRFGPGAARAGVLLRAAVRDFQPDVLHVQCFSANGAYAAALSRLLRIPLVVSLQGETVMDDRDIYDHSVSLRMGLRVGLRQASAVTACSGFVLRDAVDRFGLETAASVVIPNGVDTSGDPPPVALELPFDRFVLGLGRLVEKKGFDLLIDAFARLEDHRDLGLVIGGDGPALEKLRERASAFGLDERVALPGTLSRGQVAWAMTNADVFVMPSRVEPFGIVALEGLASGCPVIVSSRGGASEVIRDRQSGLVVDPFDSGVLSEAIERVLGDAALRKRLIDGGRARVGEFGWDRIVDRYLEVYMRAAAS
jgi:glycosyltransferase involved in cell wall biosynthesis